MDASGWQPIQTAPKDGTMVLLAGGLDDPSDWRVKVGYWSNPDNDWYILGASWEPSRWMPLPPPPGDING